MAENRTVKVTLKAEVAAYLRDIVRSADATDKLGASAVGAGSDIDRALTQSEKAAKSSGDTFTRWGTVAHTALAAVTLAAGGLFAAMVAQGVNANSAMEQNQVALTTMMKGNADAAKGALDQVYELATNVPFQFPTLAAQLKAFVSAGMGMKDILPLMHSYSAAVAALGGSGADLDQVAAVLQNIVTMGKNDAVSMRSLALAGIPAWQILAEQAGTSVDEVRKQVTAGMWDADKTIAALTAGMESRFGGMLEGMGNTYARWQDKLKGAQRRTSEQLTVPVIEVGKAVMESLTGMFNAQTSALKQADWDPIIKPLMTIPDVLDQITASIESGGVQDVIDGVGAGLNVMAEAGDLVFNVARPLVELLAAAVLAGTPLLQLLTWLLGMFNALPGPMQAALVALGLFAAFHSPLARVMTSVMASATSFGMLRTEAMMAGAAMPAVTAGLAGVTSAARSAGAAVLTAFGGPMGLAVAGGIALVTLALMSWTDATRVQEQAVATLSATLDQNTGAITEATKSSIINGLSDDGTLARLERLGVSTADYVDAIVKGGSALDMMRSRLESIADSNAFEKQAHFLNDNSEAAKKGAAAYDDATAAMDRLSGESGTVARSQAEIERKARAAGNAVDDVSGSVWVDTDAAQANLEALTKSAQNALASFIDLTPQKKKAPKKGRGGGGAGESPVVKAAKAEQAAVKKTAEAAKKAADEYEKAEQKKADAAKAAADAAVKAAEDSSKAEETALDRLQRASDAYVAAQRERMAIEVTLANTTDPARQAILSQALADALAHEADMHGKKADAEGAAALATATNAQAQADSVSKANDAALAQQSYEAATENAARVQDESATKIEAAAERMAAATEGASSRAGGAVSDFADDAKISLQEYMDQLEAQVKAQENWRDNMIKLSGRVSAGTIAALMEMGASGADIVAQMVDASDTDLARMDDLFARAGSDISTQFASDMTRLGIIVPELTRRFGADAAENLKGEFMKGKIGVDDIMRGLNAQWDGKQLTMNIDANTQKAIDKAGGLVKYIEGLIPKVSIDAGGRVWIGDHPYGRLAGGGALEGPGQKGVDSIPILAAPGEHMWTAREVDAVGGQAAMYKLRQMALHGMLRMAGGGAVPQMNLSAPSGGGGGPVIYQQVFYPQAEPSSTAANRALQEAGEL